MQTPIDLFRLQKSHHPVIRRTTAAERIAKLRRLRQAVLELAPGIREAAYEDFRKSEAEVDATEIHPVIVEINDCIRNLRKWMKPVRVRTPLALFGARSEIRYEPKGVVLVIGPWNYPFQLVLNPLAAAISAGNCCIIKPSELTPHTSALVKSLLGKLFDPSEVAVVEGGVDVTTKLLELPFDHIFFTGSTRVGRVVAEAAAKNLTPVTLELGGKSPAIVDDSADVEKAAERIAWGKFINAGQTCVAPDYVMVSERTAPRLVEGLKRSIARFYGPDEQARRANPDLCRIINARNFGRLKGMLDESVKQGARVEEGGRTDEADLYISPTILSGVKPGMPIMSDEIFGPILPILTYRSFDEVRELVTSRDKPLALYVFGSDKRRLEDTITDMTSGGACVNHAVVHLVNPYLPFGGVGASGQGSYHGVFGFKTFSHERAVLRQGPLSITQLVYPPYKPWVRKVLQLVTRFLA